MVLFSTLARSDWALLFRIYGSLSGYVAIMARGSLSF